MGQDGVWWGGVGWSSRPSWAPPAVHDVIRITVQPESQAVEEGTRVSLSCWATGPPGLAYQWFCGKQEVAGATAPELVVDTAAPPGPPHWYICRVSCGAAFAFSRWAHIQVERSGSPESASGYCPSMAGLQILQQPRPCRLAEGDPLVLECRALGNPPPQYQWFRNRRPVEGARAPRLQVQLVTTAERGTYSCRVFNLFHELWSQEVDVEIATDKVALLVGNMHYAHHKHLRAPMVDVHALGALLRQLDFKVVSLLDLRRDEMQMAVDEFLLLLDKGVYDAEAYELNQGELSNGVFVTFLKRWLLEDEKITVLLDKVAEGEYHTVGFERATIPPPQAHTVPGPTDMGTLELTRGRQALELRSNLSERRALTDPIRSSGCAETSARNLQWAKAHGVCHHHLPQRVGTWRGQPRGTGWVACGICSAPPAPRLHTGAAPAVTPHVTLSIVGDQCGVTALLAVPAVLPECRHLRFDCGVTVQLGFAAEFSNIMIIYTRILATPGDITECVAKLTDLPEELDVDLKCTNQESPEELGSPLAPTWSTTCPSCCLYSRLCGLQRLRQELSFTVCLQYRYRSMADFVEERWAVLRRL
ncbi:UNVERIFIED_CONTAM: hypothetical protein H355_003223 [Colinus virginianus]|nr:hypothetical protein H355_003223 [Colinus virginianus]